MWDGDTCPCATFDLDKDALPTSRVRDRGGEMCDSPTEVPILLAALQAFSRPAMRDRLPCRM